MLDSKALFVLVHWCKINIFSFHDLYFQISPQNPSPWRYNEELILVRMIEQGSVLWTESGPDIVACETSTSACTGAQKYNMAPASVLSIFYFNLWM